MRRDDPDLKSVSQQPRRISARLLILFCMVALLGFCAVCASVLLDMRRGEEALARQGMENLVSTIDADISRNLELYDTSLRDVAASMINPEIATAGPAVLRLILFNHAATAKHFGALQVFDAAGNLMIDSATPKPNPENCGDEDYFSVHRNNPDVGLYISRPGLYRGAYSVMLSRRITARDGSFLGVVVGSLRFSYFHELFDRLQLQPDDTITVFRRDGIVIMRTPFDLDFIGRNLSNVPGVRRTLAEPGGADWRASAIDNLLRLYIWRDSGYPLIVTTGKSWDNVFGLWRREAMRIGMSMLVLIVLVIGATLFMAREMERRAKAEDRLEQLATTDALTQLPNRRKFDVVIDHEWRRAQRQGEWLALLMIDTDHFKAFNDMFGHQAGDLVLARVAAAITASVRRAEDCAARYGGEEFAVLLPGLTAEAAFAIAEDIRTRVEMLSAEKWATTISIGVASVIPDASLTLTQLIEAADKALYEAKSRGRNQSFVASAQHLTLVA
jgi:diguanylate cyclase (GGDEF)-like protein